MVDWHPREQAHTAAWTLGPDKDTPYAIIEKHRVPYDWDRYIYYAYRWAHTPAARELIGEYDNGDDAAMAAWNDYLERSRRQHREAATRQHDRHQTDPLPAGPSQVGPKWEVRN